MDWLVVFEGRIEGHMYLISPRETIYILERNFETPPVE